MEDKLLERVFDYDSWVKVIENANDVKEMNKTTLRALTKPETRLRLYKAIVSGSYEVFPPHEAHIPKDNGDFRTVYVNEEVDRILLTLINNALFELFPYMVHPQCKSYRTGESCAKTVQSLSKEMTKLNLRIQNEVIGYRYDFSKFFDCIDMSAVNNMFDIWEQELGFEKDTEPIINILRKYYHSDLVFDIDGNLIKGINLGLRQGCAVASVLADMILYELDDFMSKKYPVYYRYSDDLICLSEDTSEITDDIVKIISKYGVSLNMKKVKEVRKDEFIKFLGFNVKNEMITLSKNRVKGFQKSILDRTLNKPNTTAQQAKQNIISYLYKGDGNFSWATACLGTINVKPDIDELNKFIMDCLRQCEVRDMKRKAGKKVGKISITAVGGLGSVDTLPDRTILRGTGKHVTSNRQKTDKEIPNYLSMGCLSNVYKINKNVFETTVRGLR